MIENAIGNFTGYVQVHQKDYWGDKSIDNGIEITDSLINTIKTTTDVEGVNLRLESFALASYLNNTKGTLIMGIIPDTGNDMLNIKSKIIKGEYIAGSDKSLILGSKLASFLDIGVGDTLVMLGQGHWGQTAVGAYPVKGIVKMPVPTLDRQIVFMPLSLAREFYSFPDGVTSIVVRFSDANETRNITSELNSKLDTALYKAIAWQDMSPEMVQQIESDRIGGIFMLAILYMIIAFGVFGTVLMMTEERKREYAVMISIGMQKSKLMSISFYETIIMNMFGIVAGVAIAIPLVLYFHYYPIVMTGQAAESIEKLGIEPIMPTMLSFKIIARQVLVIVVISLITFLYPLIAISKLNVIKAMKR
jgi:ABC-type lipoprotein release transport system permease subunit